MSYEYESKLSLYFKSDIAADCKSKGETPIDGITWSMRAYKPDLRYSTPYLYLTVLALAAENVSYAVQIRIGYFTQNTENFAPNQAIEADEFQSASGKICTFKEVLYAHPTEILINATLTIRSPQDLQPISSILKDISNPDHADFTIQIGDKTWKAHKSILSVRSPVFQRMFANKDCEESKQSRMTIADLSKETFELFLHFLYTDRIPNLSLEQTQQVLIVADKYDAQALKKKCDDMIVKMLKEDHPVHDVYQFAHVYNCSHELKKRAFDLLLLLSTTRGGKTLLDELVDEPEMVKKLVDKMTDFEQTLKE